MKRVDHLVYGVPELNAAIDRLAETLGVRAVRGGSHPQWGTHNAILSLGERTYLEILAPDPNRRAGVEPSLFGLDAVASPRLVAWAAQADDLAACVGAAARGGAPLGRVLSADRETPDGTRLSWTLTDPEVVLADGVVPFFIDWGDSAHPAAGQPPLCTLVSLRAEHPDAEEVRALLRMLEVDVPVTEGWQPALVATLDTPRGGVELR